jgi:hypothetical protein
MRTGWCIDGDHGLYYDQPSNMELHESCRHGQTIGSHSIDCECWCHTGAKEAPKKKTRQVKRNGRAKRAVVDADIDPSKAGKKGYSKNGKKLGRPKGAKNKKKVAA